MSEQVCTLEEVSVGGEEYLSAEVHFEYFEGEARTNWDPGCPEEVEVVRVVVDGCELDLSYEELDSLEDRVLAWVAQEREEYAMEAAEYAYEAWCESREDWG